MLKIDVICALKNEDYRYILNPEIKLTDTEIEASPAKYTSSIYTAH